MKNTVSIWLTILLTAALVSACAPAPSNPAAGPGRLPVLATTGIIADIAQNVGGEAVDVRTLLPTGTDPHTFQPTPRDLARVAEADILLANGLGLETFLDEMIANAGGDAQVVTVTDGLTPRVAVASEAGHDDDHESDIDPHAWTSPANALTFVDNIERAFSAADPAHAETYRANAERYAADLQALDAWVQAQIETIPPQNRKLVTDHAVFGYYADRYGLEQVGAIIPAFSAAAEPSAADVAALETAIGQAGVRAVFVGQSVNPALARQLADDTGAQMVQLFTGSLGGPGSGAETYLDYIRFNTAAIVTALK